MIQFIKAPCTREYLLSVLAEVMHGKTDSGGANIERLAGKSVDELKEACSEMAECVPPRFFCFTS